MSAKQLEPLAELTWLSGEGPGGASERDQANSRINASRSPSENLRIALEAEGGPLPPGHQAHHIVPVNLGPYEMEVLRDALHDAGVNINDATNGVALPDTSEIANPELRPRHHGDIHGGENANNNYTYSVWNHFSDLFEADHSLVGSGDAEGVFADDPQAQLRERLEGLKQSMNDNEFELSQAPPDWGVQEQY